MNTTPEIQKISEQINLMATQDQEVRKPNPKNNDREKMKAIDEKNTKRIKEIINEYGCITISKFGEKVSQNAWLLIQHADDLAFKQEYCKLMEENINDIKKSNLALLKDRILTNTGHKQLYGSQLFKGPNDPHLYVQDIEDIKNVDKRRAEMGLNTLYEYIMSFREMTEDNEIAFPEGYEHSELSNI